MPYLLTVESNGGYKLNIREEGEEGSWWGSWWKSWWWWFDDEDDDEADDDDDEEGDIGRSLTQC